MRIAELYGRLNLWTAGNGALCIAAAVGLAMLLAAVGVASACKNGWVYALVAAWVVGGVEGAAYFTDASVRAAAFFRAVTWLGVGTLGAVTGLAVALLRRRAQRKRKLIVAAKGGEGLPERQNTYVRARLHTALRTEEGETRKRVPYENRGEVRLGYARKLLAGVQDAPLTPAERLETDALARTLSQYAARERWEAEDVRAVNDLFAKLMKLAAKYAVE